MGCGEISEGFLKALWDLHKLSTGLVVINPVSFPIGNTNNTLQNQINALGTSKQLYVGYISLTSIASGLTGTFLLTSKVYGSAQAVLYVRPWANIAGAAVLAGNGYFPTKTTGTVDVGTGVVDETTNLTDAAGAPIATPQQILTVGFSSNQSLTNVSGLFINSAFIVFDTFTPANYNGELFGSFTGYQITLG